MKRLHNAAELAVWLSAAPAGAMASYPDELMPLVQVEIYGPRPRAVPVLRRVMLPNAEGIGAFTRLLQKLSEERTRQIAAERLGDSAMLKSQRERVREIREEREKIARRLSSEGLSGSEIAEHLGISKSEASRMAAGRVLNPERNKRSAA